jgi:hypothetical protein
LLGEFVRVEGGSATPGSVEGAFLRAVVGEPWRALDSRVRNHVLAALTADAESQTRWLPDPKAHVFEAEGRTLAGENAGAFGSYFIASVLVAIGVRQYRLPLPSRAFSLLGNTLGVVLEDSIFKRLSARFLETAGNAERGRAFVTIAYVHLVRAMLLGSYEREHKKLTDAVGSAEGALATGRKRFDHLREARTEIVVQTAGIIGVIAMLLAVVGYLVWSWMQG